MSEGITNTSRRFKRKFDDHSSELVSFMADMKQMIKEQNSATDAKLEALKNDVKDIKEQNLVIQNSVEFMAAKYDEVWAKLETVQRQNAEYEERFKLMQVKIELLERNSRVSMVELRNIPKQDGENRSTLIDTVKKIGSAVGQSVMDPQIIDVYRLNSKHGQISPILVNFSTSITKDTLIRSTRAYNKTKKANNEQPLNISTIGMSGTLPIYVSDSLTPQAKRLYYLAREYVKTKKEASCWTSYGKIYVRAKEGQTPIRIDDEGSLNKLK